MLNGRHVLGSPAVVSISPSSPSAAHCALRTVTAEVIAGSPAELALRLLDGFGNEVCSYYRRMSSAPHEQRTVFAVGVDAKAC